MSDLFKNHIIGFLMWQLKCYGRILHDGMLDFYNDLIACNEVSVKCM